MFTRLFYFQSKWSFNKSFLHFGMTVTLVRQSKTANMAVSSGRHHTVLFIPLSVCVLSYMKAASNDERPLITVYPCRWCAAVSMWDTPVSFFLIFQAQPCSAHCQEDTKHRSYWTHLSKSDEAGCKLRGDNVTTCCPPAVHFNGFPRKRW